MGRIRRGGYVFQWWKGDHNPRHVHVFLDRRLVMKWNLEVDRVMSGEMNSRIRDLIMELKKEGRL